MKDFSTFDNKSALDVKSIAEIAKVLLRNSSDECNEEVPLSLHFPPFYQVSNRDGLCIRFSSALN